MAFGNISTGSPYFQTEGGQRYVKAKKPPRQLLPLMLNKGENPDLRLKPRGFRERINWAKRALVNPVQLPSIADIVLLRKHLNLFYLARKVRIKVDVAALGGANQSLAREFELRKKVEEMQVLNLPPLLGGHIDRAPHFLMDRLITGTVYNWKDSNTKDVFRRLIPDLWQYHQLMGIQSKTPWENGYDLKQMANAYVASTKNHSDISFPLDTQRIITFQHQLAPCAQIHGDLVIHNIIATKEGDFLLDWESSAFDFIVRKFHRLIIIDGWTLQRDIERLIDAEIDRQPNLTKQTVLSF